MTPHARLLVAGRSACHNFLKVKHTSILLSEDFLQLEERQGGLLPLGRGVGKERAQGHHCHTLQGIHLLENISI